MSSVARALLMPAPMSHFPGRGRAGRGNPGEGGASSLGPGSSRGKCWLAVQRCLSGGGWSFCAPSDHGVFSVLRALDCLGRLGGFRGVSTSQGLSYPNRNETNIMAASVR